MLSRGFQYHKYLCPKIWNKNNQIDPLVAQAVQMMVWDFINYLQFIGVPIAKSDILDIFLHGSITNYYWDTKSDVDIGIVADLSRVNEWNPSGNVFIMIKSFVHSWKRTRPMKIAGRNIDIKLIDKTREYSREYWRVGPHYSVLHNRWVHVPVRLSRDELHSLSKNANSRYRVWLRQCKTILRQDMSAEFIDAYLVDLQRVRVNAMIKNHAQPLVSGTLAFKMLRNTGIIKKMRDKSKKLQSKTYSIY